MLLTREKGYDEATNPHNKQLKSKERQGCSFSDALTQQRGLDKTTPKTNKYCCCCRHGNEAYQHSYLTVSNVWKCVLL